MSASLSLAVLALGLCLAPSALAASTPTELRVEWLRAPLGLDVQRPRFSWIGKVEQRGAGQSAYHVLVASSPELLARSEGDLWDSGKVDSSQHTNVMYGGAPLKPGTHASWKVRTWDERGKASDWSAATRFSIGLLDATNWHAQWIEDPTPAADFTPANNGYHSQMSGEAHVQKWITIDLGKVHDLDGVVLWPARPYNWTRDEPGFLFPKRFVIETALQPDFGDAGIAVDRGDADVAKPGPQPWRTMFDRRSARYVRLRAIEMRERDAGEYGLALAEMEVLGGGRNLALGAAAKGSDSIETSGWSIRSLTDGDTVSHGPIGPEPLMPPRFRKTFTVPQDAEVRQATLYATALGLYELFINGERVGEQYLAPEWTDYHTRVQYQTFDVTNMLRRGENVLAAQLGDGWYAGRVGLSFIVPDGLPRGIYGRKPKLLAQLEIERADGTAQRLVTDETWRYSTQGPWREADLLDGVVYDARREQPGWSEPGYDDSPWATAQAVEIGPVELVGQANEAIRVTEERPAVSRSEPRPSVFVYDLGQNLAGWVRVTLDGPAGATVTLRHAEVLNQDGTIYTENLRSAKQADRYILAGNGPRTFEPRFTYHGFRYVELTGMADPPAPDDLVACAVHSAAPLVGTFECSEALLNQLWSNVLWTQRANLHSTPTDCPQRDERLGWTGDILAFAPTACFNMDMQAFLDKWLRDMRDAQAEDGRYPDFAPHPYDPEARFSGVPAWGDAGVHVAWDHYRFYGDKKLLAEHFDSACRWVDWIHASNPDLLWKNERHNDYGDWLNADTLQLDGWPRTGAGVPKEIFATAFFARSAQLVARMAQELGRNDQARRYHELADDIRVAFNKAYVDADGRITGDTQAGYAIALNFDLLPEHLQQKAVEHMIRCFDRYDGQISTGFHSTICLMRELSARGRVEEAYRLALNRKMPSWGYAIDRGATTIWERWDGYVEGRGFQNPGMNSFAHYAIGSVGEWLYTTVLGIRPLEPSFRHFGVAPRPGGGLTWARGSYDSIHGRIAVDWRIEHDTLTLRVVVPMGATAVVTVPTMEASSVRESGAALADAGGISDVHEIPGGVRALLAPGEYTFTAAYAQGR